MMINMCDAYMMIFDWLTNQLKELASLIVMNENEQESFNAVME